MIWRYSIVLKSQLGPKAGKLNIRESKDELLCILELLGHNSLLTGNKLSDGKSFRFAGQMWTPLGQMECRISCMTGDHLISGVLNIGGKVYQLSGKEFK